MNVEIGQFFAEIGFFYECVFQSVRLALSNGFTERIFCFAGENKKPRLKWD